MEAELVVERVVPHSPLRVWAALTTPSSARRWLKAEGFGLELGRRFTVQLPGGPTFDGRVTAEIVGVEAGRRLDWSWTGGPVVGQVTLTLEPAGDGTRVTLVQTGFDRAGQAALRPALGAFWVRAFDDDLPRLLGAAVATGAVFGGSAAASAVAIVLAIAGLIALLLLLLGGWSWWSLGTSEPPDAARATVGSPVGGGPAPDTAPRPPGAPASVAAPLVHAVHDGHVMNPVWSKEGRFIAFEVNTYAGTTVQLHLAELDGTGLRPSRALVLPGQPAAFGAEASTLGPSWHEQGVVLFEGITESSARIYFASPGGAAPAEMLSRDQAPGALSQPVVSPDGMAMVFTSDAPTPGALHHWDRRDNEVTSLVSGADGPAHFPAWSTDGTRVAFTRIADPAELFEVDVASGAIQLRVPDGRTRSRPVYAGSDLLHFARPDDGGWDLAIADVEGRVEVLVPDVRLPERAAPALSPDGRFVFVGRVGPGVEDAIWRFDRGSRQLRSVATGIACGEPAVVERDGRVWLAWTALPAPDAPWRRLYAADITDAR